jgi:hypothetical protein
MRILRVLALVLFACGGSAQTEPPKPAAQAPQPSAVDEIVAHMKHRYAMAKTYSDEGTLQLTIRGPNGHTQSSKLQTHWRAPDRLRFDFDEIHVWTTREGEAKTWFIDKTDTHESLDAALYALQGVTHATTALVPRWLAFGVAVHPGYVVRGEAPCGTSTCIVLAGKNNDRDIEMFIDKTTYALRRHRSKGLVKLDTEEIRRRAEALPEPARSRVLEHLKHEVEPFEVETSLDLDPKFDAPIDEAALDFTPPR